MPPRRIGRIPLGWSLLFLLVISLASTTFPANAASSDLTIVSIWLEDAAQVGQQVSQVSPGQPFNIVVTIKNIGQGAASGYYLDVYYDSDYGRGGPDNIAPGEVQTWYVGPLTAQAGTHTTKWVVDPDNQIVEMDETNNQKELAFTVGSQTTTTTVTSSSPSSTTKSTSTTTATMTSTSTSSTIESTSTMTSTTSSTSYTSSSNPAQATLVLTPASGPPGTIVSVSGANYQGNTCALSAAPSGLFGSQSCSISAGSLSGSFTVSSDASASSYTVTVETDLESQSATFTVTSRSEYAATMAGISLAPTMASVGQGSKMTFTVAVQNTGSKDISTAKVQLMIYKPDGRLAASPYAYITSFKAGTERTVKLAYTLSSSAQLGYWTYGVYVYRSSTLLDQVTGQGFTVQPAVRTGEIVMSAHDPDPVVHGKTATFTVKVKNTGNTVWSSGKVTVKIYKPDGTTLYTTKSLSISNLTPGVEYIYDINWAVSSTVTTGTYTYDVYFYYGTSTLMSSDMGNPSNAITIN